MATEKNKASTNRYLLIINIILLIAVAILYYFHFSQPDQPVQETMIKSQSQLSGTTDNLKIAYINSDSILTHYKLAIKKSKDLETKGRRMEMEINSKQKQYEEDAGYFQEQVNNNALSQESAQYIYEQLMQAQQDIIDLQEQYGNELAQEEFRINIMLVDSVTNFLERFNKTYNFDYILGYSKGGNLFLTNKRYDITSQVLRGLNEEYVARYGDIQ